MATKQTSTWHSTKIGPKSKKQQIKTNIESMYHLVIVSNTEKKLLSIIQFSTVTPWENVVKMFNIESWAYYNDVINDALSIN